jgi:hypothetical protein
MDGQADIIEFLDFLLDLYPNLSRDDVLNFMSTLKPEEDDAPSPGAKPLQA